MILIPELETIMLLVPRTGSGSFYRSILTKHPRATMLYRHMEADGVPFGYDRWTKVGVVRNPIDRLWSLYKFMSSAKFKQYHSDEAALLQFSKSVDRPFSDWILNNETMFSTGFDRVNTHHYWAEYATLHQLPENRKSQFHVLRPDLGTHVYRFDELDDLAERLEIEPGRINATPAIPHPPLSHEADVYMRRVFAWDFSVTYNRG